MKGGFLFLSFIFCLNASGQEVGLVTLNQLYDRVDHGRDTIYVINFWATWCVPCVKELQNFERLSNVYKNKNLKVLLISLDFKSKLNESVLPFVKRNKMKNEVFMLNEPDPQIYINRIDSSWSGALPATLMVKNKKRKFFEKGFTYSELLNEYKNFK
ncbi:MAG TPA: TlpA disulfide reductase family protein [Puia sp.]|nr:TlpA disulfide reductase family protein [Puia sp.]